ncbi:MAG: cytidine deaminase [Armatimonadetes bacterium]|nr:cytidine deaminase [Armatimonadota bacterium]MCX7969153.1 cytidine deaminase [Armatimonadota bacterium]MDW8143896.1 cytidine deaminase [Armatimonadota bacterium]
MAIDWDALIAAAQRVRKRAYAPYSRFQVGAALLGKSGRIYVGCNVENASYGLTICAERNAVFSAVAEGEREFVALVVAGKDPQVFPCGACRQVLAEFCDDLPILIVGEDGTQTETSLCELLPHAFRFKENIHKVG